MAAEKIDALELEITSKLSTENLDKLIESLKKLGKEVDNVKNKKPKDAVKGVGDGATEAANGIDKFLGKAVRITAVIALFNKATGVISDSVAKTLTYDKTLNMFTVSLGEYAKNATKYGETVSNALGIDIAGWQKTQGIFQTLITGFGVGGDQAAYMSQNLTQLAYDIASFNNLTNEEAANKIKSAIAGRLEPIRGIGYDLSQSKLVDIAKNPKYYGQQTFAINEQTGAIEANTVAVDDNTQHKIVNFNQLTQQEKVQLRYIALMTQLTQVQGNFARTLRDPANQMKVFKEQTEMTSRALGSIFIPALNQVLPYLTAFAQLAGEAFRAIAKFFGYEVPDMSDRMDISSVSEPYNDVVEATGKAAKNAKKLKDYTIGLDELNVLKKPDDTLGGGSGRVGENSNLSNLLTPGYDFLSKAIKSSVEQARADIELLRKDFKAHPLHVAAKIIWDGASELGSKLWELILGKTPEEFALEAEQKGKEYGEYFVESFLEALGEVGSKFWEAMLGTPDEMQRYAERAGKSVEEALAETLLDRFTAHGKVTQIVESITGNYSSAHGSSSSHVSKPGMYRGRGKGYATGTGSATVSNANVQMAIKAPEVSFGNTSADEARKRGEEVIKAYAGGITSGGDAVQNAANGVFNKAVNGVDKNGKGGQEFGNTAANEAYKYAMGLTSPTAKSNAYVSGLTLASQGAKGSGAYANDNNTGFSYAGRMSGQGYIGGLEKYKNKASSSGRIIAEAALNTLKKVLGIHSPSTAYGEQAYWSVMGYAKNMEKYSYLAENSAKDMATSALKAVETANATLYNGTAIPTTANTGFGIGVANEGAMMSLVSGIYNAVASGMTGANNEKGDTAIMIDGKEVFRVVKKEERKSGIAIGNGAFV